MPATSPVHEIDPALLPAGRVDEIDVGTAVYDLVGGPGTEPLVVHGEFPHIILDAPYAPMVTTGGVPVLTGPGIVCSIVAALSEDGGTPWSYGTDLQVSGTAAMVMQDELAFDEPVTGDTAPHSWVLWTDGEDTAVICDGEVVKTGTGASAPSAEFAYLYVSSGGVVYYVGVWEELLTLEGAQDFSLAQMSLIPTPSTPVTQATWEAPAHDGGMPVTGYLVRWVDLTGAVVERELEADATSCEVPAGLPVQVIALNAVGQSTPVEVVGAS